MKLTNLIPIKAGKTLSRLCIIGALSFGSSFVFAQNQQVRLSGNNLTLKAAFKQIEQQTKLFVDYNTQDVNDSRVIKKVPVGDNVKNVLEQLLEGMNCSVTFSNGHVIISRKAPASSETKKSQVLSKMKRRTDHRRECCGEGDDEWYCYRFEWSI